MLILVDMTKNTIVRKRNIEKILKFWKRYVVDMFFGVFQRGNGKFCLVKNAPSGTAVSNGQWYRGSKYGGVRIQW